MSGSVVSFEATVERLIKERDTAIAQRDKLVGNLLLVKIWRNRMAPYLTPEEAAVVDAIYSMCEQDYTS